MAVLIDSNTKAIEELQRENEEDDDECEDDNECEDDTTRDVDGEKAT